MTGPWWAVGVSVVILGLLAAGVWWIGRALENAIAAEALAELEDYLDRDEGAGL